MDQPPSPPASDPLPLLSVFHFVLAGLSGIGVLLGVFYAFFARFLMNTVTAAAIENGGTINGKNVNDMTGEEQEAALAMFDTMGSMFTVIGLFIAVLSLVFAIMLIKGGLNLRNATGYTFCMVTAGASCLLFPFGTALGIFSLVTLSKPEVKARFS